MFQLWHLLGIVPKQCTKILRPVPEKINRGFHFDGRDPDCTGDYIPNPPPRNRCHSVTPIVNVDRVGDQWRQAVSIAARLAGEIESQATAELSQASDAFPKLGTEKSMAVIIDQKPWLLAGTAVHREIARVAVGIGHQRIEYYNSRRNVWESSNNAFRINGRQILIGEIEIQRAEQCRLPFYPRVRKAEARDGKPQESRNLTADCFIRCKVAARWLDVRLKSSRPYLRDADPCLVSDCQDAMKDPRRIHELFVFLSKQRRVRLLALDPV